MNKYWKIIIPLLFALAIAFGLLQREQNPYLGFKTQTFQLSEKTAPDKSLADYYAEAQKYADNSANTSATFLATGDIVLSRKVAQKIKLAGNIDLPFANVFEIFNSADFAFGNLESPSSGTEYFNAGETMVFNAPASMLPALKNYKFKALNLANNHALDQGFAGLTYTLQTLKDMGIQTTGAGENLKEAWQPAIVESNGIKICILGTSYASLNDGGKTQNEFVARMEDDNNLKTGIEKSKSLCDFVVASMHAGIEYKRLPNQAQENFARLAIDYGADLVIGHHPHWIQTVEKYKGKYIFYSLGNFIFDQMWSQDTKEGLLLKIKISKQKTINPHLRSPAGLEDLQGGKLPAKLEFIELIPIIIEDYSTPRPADQKEAKTILKKIELTEKIFYP